MKTSSLLTALLIHSAAQSVATAFAFSTSQSSTRVRRTLLSSSTAQYHRQPHKAIKNTTTSLKSTTNDDTTESVDASSEISKAPTLNGKMVLPLKAMMVGLKGHKVAAVYALLNKNYKRG
jgi:Flp pilus assembly protein TadB